ncbi:unnamed protein product, partial [Closterium sp. Yama58-4]
MNLLATHASAQDAMWVSAGMLARAGVWVGVTSLAKSLLTPNPCSTLKLPMISCADECGGICGTDADCVVNDLGTSVCKCKDGSTFNEFNYTCDGVVDECGGICGTDADCVVNGLGTGVCQCKDGSTFNDVDYTCDGVVVPSAMVSAALVSAALRCCLSAISTIVLFHQNSDLLFSSLHSPHLRSCLLPPSSFHCATTNSMPSNPHRHHTTLNGHDTASAPLLQTTVQLQLQVKENGRPRSYPENVKFTTNGPAAQASGDTACTDLTSSFSLRGDTQISIQWQSYGLQGAGNGMCKSVSFFSNPGCTGKPGLTISRPAKNGGSYRNTDRTATATDLPKSVGCEITFLFVPPFVVPTTATCHKDCGTAECVVEGGQPQCHCPWGFTFNEAEKICSEKTFNPADNSCKTGTLKCDKNFMCVVKNGQGMCQCNGGYTKTNGLCT